MSQQPAVPKLSTAGVGMRFLATFIDAAVLGLIVAPLADVSTVREPFSMRIHYNGPGAFWAWAIAVVYFTVLEGTIGATVGKLVVGLRVRREDGSHAGLGSSLVRNLLRVIDALPYALPYLLGAIFVWTSPTRQRLGDRIAKTVVIHSRSQPSPVSTTVSATASPPAPTWGQSSPGSSPTPELPPPPPGSPPP